MEITKDSPWKVLSTEYICREPWLTARRDRIELPDGRIIPEYYVLEYPTWINVIAITTDGQMVMVRQHRHGLGVTSTELCAGVMDPTDATPMDAARRELMEETGFGGGQWTEHMVISANPGTHNNLTYSFLATGVEKIGTQHLDDTEDLTALLLSQDEVLDMLRRGEVLQSLMAAPLWKYFYELKVKS